MSMIERYRIIKETYLTCYVKQHTQVKVIFIFKNSSEIEEKFKNKEKNSSQNDDIDNADAVDDDENDEENELQNETIFGKTILKGRTLVYNLLKRVLFD